MAIMEAISALMIIFFIEYPPFKISIKTSALHSFLL